MYTSDSVSQVVMLYLFIQFSAKKKKAREAFDEEEDEELNELEADNTEMLYYMRQKPGFNRRPNLD